MTMLFNYILVGCILKLARCECQSFRAKASTYHRPSLEIEKYEAHEWIQNNYPRINNWPTFTFYDNDSCRDVSNSIYKNYTSNKFDKFHYLRCYYVMKRHLVYLKDNRRPSNTYEKVHFNNSGWTLVIRIYDIRFDYYNNGTKLDRLYLYDSVKLQTDKSSYLDFLCSKWKNTPGHLLVTGTAHQLKTSLTLISITITICIIIKKMVYQPHINMYIKGNIPITMLVFQPPLTKTVKPTSTAK